MSENFIGSGRCGVAVGPLLALSLSLAALLALASAAFANTYRPTRTDDPTPNGCRERNCSLREAVIAANHHPGHDKIVLEGGTTYNLSRTGIDEDHSKTGDLDILDSVTITHTGSKRATINAHHIDRVFHFPCFVTDCTSVAHIPATLSGLVIRGGNLPGESGGGIDVDNGALQLVNSIVRGDSAASGAGIDADSGSVRITKSTVAGNSAGGAGTGGGGIWTGVPTVILSSTVSGNSGADLGGGVYVSATTATFLNDTIANNHAGGDGGGINDDSAAVTNLNAVTIARNSSGKSGGGIDEENGVINVENSLIALNHQGGGLFGPDCHEADIGGIVSHGHNLIGDTAGCTGIFGVSDITDVDPKIGKLANNGGPTKTIALLRHSRAINHADSHSPSRDQRGFKRDSKPDIGAFERGAGP